MSIRLTVIGVEHDYFAASDYTRGISYFKRTIRTLVEGNHCTGGNVLRIR